MRPVFARHAASLCCGGGGIEVLMGVRGAGHRFMPNRLVFPGGAVDRGDGVAPAASEPNAATLALIGRVGAGGVMAAARELWRAAEGEPPALAEIFYLCRAITPPVSPIRFNARFWWPRPDWCRGWRMGRRWGRCGSMAVAEALEAGLMRGHAGGLGPAGVSAEGQRTDGVRARRAAFGNNIGGAGGTMPSEAGRRAATRGA